MGCLLKDSCVTYLGLVANVAHKAFCQTAIDEFLIANCGSEATRFKKTGEELEEVRNAFPGLFIEKSAAGDADDDCSMSVCGDDKDE